VTADGSGSKASVPDGWLEMNTREIQRMVNDDGKVVATFEYLEGVLDGVTRVYTPGGTLVQELHYVAGQLHGPYHTWWETGLPKESGECSNGQRIGEYRWHNIDGTLSQSHNYVTPDVDGLQ